MIPRVRRRLVPLLCSGAAARGAAAATTTWNPSDKSASITLSNGNLTATCTAGTRQGVRAVQSQSTGKYYCEFTADNGSTNTVVGIGNASMVLTVQFFGGTDKNGVGYAAGGLIWLNGVNPSTIASYADGDNIGMAVDLDAKLIWYRVNGGNWNNNASANPATGTLGIDWSIMNAGPYFPGWSAIANTEAITANFGAGAYANAAPSGFGSW